MRTASTSCASKSIWWVRSTFACQSGCSRRRNIDAQMVIERMDRTIRFKKIAFNDPDEVMLLPESIDQLSLWRGGMQSTRRSHIFSDYRRFVTGARLVK